MLPGGGRGLQGNSEGSGRGRGGGRAGGRGVGRGGGRGGGRVGGGGGVVKGGGVQDGVEGVGRDDANVGHRGGGGAGGGRGNVLVNGGGRGRGLGRGIVPGHRSIDALMASEARRLMPVLDPNRENGALWFGTDNGPRRVIVAAIRRHFDGPWFNMSSVPNETIIQWWGEFIQAFYWEPQHGAMVYSFWYNITAARLRDMVCKAKNGPERPEWISQTIWDIMWIYWNSEEGKQKSRIAAANRLSNRDGYGRHAHTSGARFFNQVRELIRQQDSIELSMLQVLRETHRKADGTYVDGRAQSIDEEIQRQVRDNIALGSETQDMDGTGVTGLTQLQEDKLYLKVVTPTQGGRVYGLGGQQPIRERGESSSMAATRLTLERQVTALQQQLSAVVDYMKRFMPPDGDANAEPNRSSTPRTMASATGPARLQASDLEATLEAVVGIDADAEHSVPREFEVAEQNEEEENDEFAAY